MSWWFAPRPAPRLSQERTEFNHDSGDPNRKRCVNLLVMQSELQIQGLARRRHPIRSHVRRAAALEQKARDDSDVKLFALSFTAFFVCFYTFIF